MRSKSNPTTIAEVVEDIIGIKQALTLMFVVALLVSPMTASGSQAEVSLSDGLFYAQLQNPQPQNNVVIVSRKDPFIAGALSFLITGLGQVYNGETTKGLLHFAVAVSGYTLYFLALEDNYYYYGWWDPDGDDAIGVGGLLVGFGTAIWSVIDAPLSANRINRRNAEINARQFNQQTFSAKPLLKSDKVGAALTFRW